MLRPALIILTLAYSVPMVAAPYVPPGLVAGDHYQLIFATSFLTGISNDTTVPPSLPFFGGLTAADYLITETAASAGQIPNSNSTDITWKAILSTSTVDARDHISIQAPIYDMHGELVATSAADLWDGTIANPIAYNESGGQIVGGLNVWTGTNGMGVKTSETAGDWHDRSDVGSTGNLSFSNSAWIERGSLLATDSARLYGISPLLTVPLSPPGDYNFDGTVDAADYTIWRETLGSTTDLRANGDNTGASAGKIDQADYNVWNANFGMHAGSGASAAVPEPDSATLLGIGLLAILIGYCRSESRFATTPRANST